MGEGGGKGEGGSNYASSDLKNGSEFFSEYYKNSGMSGHTWHTQAYLTKKIVLISVFLKCLSSSERS